MTANDCYLGKADSLLGISLCPLCPHCRCADRALLLPAGCDGTKAGLYNLLIAVVVAVIIVLAMNLVGSLLISALVIFPALSAMRMFKSFRSVTICAAVLSVFCALLGILASILAGTPVGSTIVAVQIGAFGLSWLAGTVLGGVRR